MNARALAATVINNVINDHQSMSQALPAALNKLNKAEDKAFVSQLSYGCLRWYPQLLAIANQLLFTPLKPKNHDVLCLLITGIYQLLYLKTPAYAAVSETVAASKQIKKPWAARLLNKTLRQFSNDTDKVVKAANQGEVTEYVHPVWLVKRIKAAYPEQWAQILNANNSEAPMTLRVNRQRISRERYQVLLDEANIEARSCPINDDAIQLAHATAVEHLPLFDQGAVYVQDLCGQLVVDQLELEPELQVLDTCAAPGSKTTHLLEREPSLRITAVDNQVDRLPKIRQNIQRLQLPNDHLHLVLADVCNVDQWWQGEQFDRILVDAPCSATGVIRRHPDIKWLRQDSDIEQLTQLQARILDKVWPLLKPGGIMLYTTCSILPAENGQTVKRFLSTHKDAKQLPLELPIGQAVENGWQCLPEAGGHDGFFYAKLTRTR